MTPCKKTNGMKDPQIVPDDAIKVEGSVGKGPNNKKTNIRPNSETPLRSEPDGKPLIVTTVIDPKEPQELGKIKPKTAKNVKGIKVQIKRTPEGPFESLKEKDVTGESKPDNDGVFDPKKPIKLVEGTQVTEVKVTFLPDKPEKPMQVQLKVHACFEKKSTGRLYNIMSIINSNLIRQPILELLY